MNILLVFNRTAGWQSEERFNRLESEFEAHGHRVRRVDSWQIGVTPEVKHADLICIAGGDGTARDVIAQLDGWADIPVCIYPTGTINLIAREAGYGRNIAGFVKRISSAQPPRQHYVGRITNKPFLACASVGPDSLSVAAVSADLKRRIGRFAYVVSLARLLWDWPRMRLSVSANGHIHRCEAAFVLKGHYFAGPWTLAPEADLRKPDFQLLLLGKARRRDYLRLILFATTGAAFDSRSWQRLSCDVAEIDCEAAHPVQADGDIVAHLPVRFEISDTAVRFV